MLVIVSISRLDNDRIEIRLDFGINQEAVVFYLKLLAQMGENEQLKFPPVDVPRHQLLSNGFRL